MTYTIISLTSPSGQRQTRGLEAAIRKEPAILTDSDGRAGFGESSREVLALLGDSARAVKERVRAETEAELAQQARYSFD